MNVSVRDNKVYHDGAWVFTLQPSKRFLNHFRILDLAGRKVGGVHRPFCRQRWKLGLCEKAGFKSLESALAAFLHRLWETKRHIDTMNRQTEKLKKSRPADRNCSGG